MAIINKGTAFSNGEQLSASKLNDLVDGATFGTDSVDNASTLVNASGAITVRDSGITTAKILDANVTFAKLADVIDDDTMATATDTTLATSESIKAYVTAMRPKFVNITGGTLALSIAKGSLGTETYTYNIADFTSSDPKFATNKIVGLVIMGYASSGMTANTVQAELPNGTFTTIVRASAPFTADFDQSQTTTTIPINSGQTAIDVTLKVTNEQTTAAQFDLMGFIIQPGL
tara:strand:+ start:180 stop:875 length:696 start_codon:yes stop_codon:yes gene_type:complete